MTKIDGFEFVITKHIKSEIDKELKKRFDEYIRLKEKERLLARAIDYIKHHIAGHKTFDYPAARELILEYEEMEKRG